MNAPLVDDPSPARKLVRELVADLGRNGAHIMIETIVSRLSLDERVALAFHWPFWARSKQIVAPGTWRSLGLYTSRGWGKTRTCSNFVNTEIEEGRAKQIGVLAQDEENTILVNIKGPNGLIATSPPWFQPEWEAGEKILHYPNGARVIVRTPEVPGKIRGFDYDMTWMSELQSWPKMKREEAFMNARLATRVDLARIVWDATPKRGHPILKRLREENERDPDRFRIVRGTIFENIEGLGEGVVADLEGQIGGTSQGREELLGEDLDDAEGALVIQKWIDDGRKRMPAQIVRRVLGLDCAVTSRAGNDQTGILDVALGRDSFAYVLGDYTGRHAPEEWADKVIDKYFAGRCDCVVIETNKAGETVLSTLRLAAKLRGIAVHILAKGAKGEKDEIPRHTPGVINVRTVYARGEKAERAKPLALAYEKKRIAHVFGIDLSDLEETLTTWEPEAGMRSPDRLDALVHAVGELLELKDDGDDPRGGFPGIGAVNRALRGVASRESRRPVGYDDGGSV